MSASVNPFLYSKEAWIRVVKYLEQDDIKCLSSISKNYLGFRVYHNTLKFAKELTDFGILHYIRYSFLVIAHILRDEASFSKIIC